jgi:hypothetical protein
MVTVGVSASFLRMEFMIIILVLLIAPAVDFIRRWRQRDVD